MSVERGQIYKPRWWAGIAFMGCDMPKLLVVTGITCSRLTGEPMEVELQDAHGINTRRGFLTNLNRRGEPSGFRLVPDSTPPGGSDA